MHTAAMLGTDMVMDTDTVMDMRVMVTDTVMDMKVIGMATGTVTGMRAMGMHTVMRAINTALAMDTAPVMGTVINL